VFYNFCRMRKAVYGFLQGAWPFGVIEAVWVLTAVHRLRTIFMRRLYQRP
jgi:hypothetical protein